MSLTPRAVAVQGVGFTPRLLAVQGIWPQQMRVFDPAVHAPRRRIEKPRKRRDDDEVLLISILR